MNTHPVYITVTGPVLLAYWGDEPAVETELTRHQILRLARELLSAL